MTKTKKRDLLHANGMENPFPAMPSPDNSKLVAAPIPAQLIKLDLGCGPNPRDGFEGVDIIQFDGKVKHVLDVTQTPWPWPDCSVEEAHASHFLEHITNFNGKWERVKFFNELHRVLIPKGKATIVIPHWCSNRYYGDPTHKEPFSEMGIYYLNREWRLGCPEKGLGANAPHDDIKYNPNGYSCDFDFEATYGEHPHLANRALEFKQFALQWYRDAATDLVFTITKRPQ